MSDATISTRREFVRGGLSLLSAAGTVPLFLHRTAAAMEPRSGARLRGRAKGTGERVLVVLQLAGGNDGLNTIIPYRNDIYHRARPQLAIARKDALRLTDDIGLHPQAEGLKELYDDGLLCVVQGAGYPNPDRSHFKSTDIWESGDPSQRTHRGWLGRYFDCACKGNDPPDPKSAIALVGEPPLALQGDRFSPVAFSTPDQLAWRPGDVSAAAREAFQRLNHPDEGHNPDGTLKPLSRLEYLQRTALDARLSARDIQDAAGGGGRARIDALLRPRGGGQLASQLQMVARMIAADLPTRVYYVSLGGFDTHAGQAGRHGQLMKQLGDGLRQFMAELKASGQRERVLLMTFSEFGRRVAENASQGTDHGAAAPLMLVGEPVRGGLANAHPDLGRLDAGDVPWQVDFRSIYATVLTRWLRADARRVLGGNFPMPDLLRVK